MPSCMRHPFKHSDKTKSNGKSSSKNRSESTKALLNSKRDNDSKAVDWWRGHKNDGKDNSPNKNEPIPNILSDVSKARDDKNDEIEVVLHDAIMPPVIHKPYQKQNPLETPYEFSHRELPIKPENGMVLHPRLLPQEDNGMNDGEEIPSLGIFVTKGRMESDDGANRMEIFKPRVVGSPSRQKTQLGRQAQLLSRNHHTMTSPPTGMKEKLQYIADMEKGNFGLRETVADVPFKHGRKHQMSPPVMPSVKSEEKREMLNQSMDKSSRRVPVATKAVYSLESSDHLSDVPSDVDSITRERYLLACQMLKMTIVQKESALIPIEKDYILGLLEDFETKASDDSVITEDHVSAVEHAILHLEERNSNPASPATAARTHHFLKKSVNGVKNERRSDKNPHTATRKPMEMFMEHISNPCKPIRLGKHKDEGNNNISGEDKGVHLRSGDYFDTMEASSGFDDEQDVDYGNGNRLVRFDGWSFQHSGEYPFAILGMSDGDNMDPRVFTPEMMEGLRGFMPIHLYDHNFWLRFSLSRDGGSLGTLLTTIRASPYTMIGVETDRGEVFGCFTGSPWKIGGKWYGSNVAFLWRLKKRRFTSPRNSTKPNFEREIEVYPCTGDDELIQFCTSRTMAVGGGDWGTNSCPYSVIDQGIGFMVDGDLAGGETNSCGTFANPKLARYTTSSSEFTITNLEVWSLTACTNIEDARRAETQDLGHEFGEAETYFLRILKDGQTR